MQRVYLNERNQTGQVWLSGYTEHGVLNIETLEVEPKNAGVATQFLNSLLQRLRRGKCPGVRIFDAGPAVSTIARNLGFHRELGNDWIIELRSSHTGV